MNIPRDDGLDFLRVLLVCAIGMLAFVMLGCVPYGSKAQLKAVPQRPNMDGVFALVGRFGLGHGCPIGDGRFALTSAHNADHRPFDNTVPLFGARWSDGYGNTGTIEPQNVSSEGDVAVVTRVDGKPWANPYQLASEAPKEGERLYFVGYDYRNKAKALRPRYEDGPVLYVFADNVVLDATTWPGSSGGCLLNERGEVVALPTWWPFPLENTSSVALSVGVWSSIESVTALLRDAEERVQQKRQSRPEAPAQTVLR